MPARSKTLSMDTIDAGVEDLKASELNSKRALKDLWWLFSLKGGLLVVLGFMAVIWPGITLYVLSVLFAIYFLVQGAISIVTGVRSLAGHQAWFLRTALGVLEVGIGVYLVASEVATQVALFVIYVGLMFLIQGIIEVVEALANSRDSGHRILLGVSGALAIIAGLILIRYPLTAGVTFAWVIGLYGILAGTMGLIYGLSLRSSR